MEDPKSDPSEREELYENHPDPGMPVIGRWVWMRGSAFQGSGPQESPRPERGSRCPFDVPGFELLRLPEMAG